MVDAAAEEVTAGAPRRRLEAVRPVGRVLLAHPQHEVLALCAHSSSRLGLGPRTHVYVYMEEGFACRVREIAGVKGEPRSRPAAFVCGHYGRGFRSRTDGRMRARGKPAYLYIMYGGRSENGGGTFWWEREASRIESI